MAKRFHQSRKKLADRDMYSGYDNRNATEAKDSGMISADCSSMANLPQAVMMKEYPKFRYGLDPELNDTIRGIDKQMSDDESQMKRHLSRSKK
jgi:hypothetical protein